jgi:hypothetical protein
MEPTTPEIRYKRLTRAAGRGGFSVAFQSRASLWLGPDHLLSVDSSGYTETYKRFYFQDIQAFVVQKTRRYQILNIILGGIVLLLLILAVAIVPKTDSAWNSEGPTGVIILGIIIGLFLVVLVLNLIAGPTCKTFLRTAVQIEQLPSLGRVRSTRRVLKKIQPLISAAQGGELSAESISAQMREWSAPTPQSTSPETAEDDPNAPPRLNA